MLFLQSLMPLRRFALLCTTLQYFAPNLRGHACPGLARCPTSVGRAGAAAFEDVFLAGAGGLDHLINGAVALGEEFVSETKGQIIDDLGFVEGVESLVIPAWGEQVVGRMGSMFLLSRILPILPIMLHSGAGYR